MKTLVDLLLGLAAQAYDPIYSSSRGKGITSLRPVPSFRVNFSLA